MEATLRALLGENAKGLSAQTVSRLKMQWKDEYETWSRRSLKDKKYVYVWADGVTFVNGDAVNRPNDVPTNEQKKNMTKENIAA